MAYQNYYTPSQPSGQGYQGQQGANQTPKPQVQAQQYRGSAWTPPPSSTQPGQDLYRSPEGNQRTQASPLTSYQDSPVTPSGQTNYQQTQRWSGPSSQNIASSLSGGMSGGQQGAWMAQGQPQTQPTTTVPPPTPDPFQGRGVWTGQQWVPNDHPIAIEFLQRGGGVAQPAPGGGAQPNPALYSPYGQYPGRPDGTVYQPGQMPEFQFQDYQTAQFNQQAPGAPSVGQVSQFQAPDLSGLYGQQDAVIQQMLASGSMSPQVVAQMQERQKQDALAMQQQMGGQMMQGAASRGTLDGGATAAGQRNLQDQTMSQILGSNRDIDIAAQMQNRQDMLNALQASQGLVGQRADIAQGFYNTGLQGQMAQEGLNQQGFENLFRNAQFGAEQEGRQAAENQFAFGSQFQAPSFQRDSFLAQQGLNQQGANSGLGAYQTDLDAFFQNRQQNLQQELANKGIDVDLRRLTSQEGMFDRSMDLDWARLLNDMQMGRYGLGLSYADLQNQIQNGMMGRLFPQGVI